MLKEDLIYLGILITQKPMSKNKNMKRSRWFKESQRRA